MPEVRELTNVRLAGIRQKHIKHLVSDKEVGSFMTNKQVTTLAFILFLGIGVNWTGEYLIHQHFEKNTSPQPVENETLVFNSPGEESEPITLEEETIPGASEFNLLRKISAEDVEGSSSGNLVDEIADQEDQPGKLKSDILAAPIKPENEKVLKELIARELPDISKDEQEIWLEELSDLSLRAARDLLIMRKKMGMLPIKTDLFDLEKSQTRSPVITDLPEADEEDEVQENNTTEIPANLDQLAMINSSIKTLEKGVNIVLNNIANASTPGFKKTVPLFSAQPYQNSTIPYSDSTSGGITSVGISSGSGVHLTGTSIDFKSGELIQTENPLDLAISGDGFFPVTDGLNVYYLRAGHFTVNSDGNVCLAIAQDSYLIDPTINVPADTKSIQISMDGIVSINQHGSTATTEIGQIQLARFTNPKGLLPVRDNLFQETSSSGAPIQGAADSIGLGTISQYYIEKSNVNLADEKLLLQSLARNIKALREASAILSSDHPEKKVPEGNK